MSSDPEGSGGEAAANQHEINEEAARLLGDLGEDFSAEVEAWDLVVEQWDTAKGDFYGACTAYLGDPDNERRSKMGVTSAALFHSFNNCIRYISATETDPERGMKAAFRLLYDEDETRSNLFNSLTNTSNFLTYPKDAEHNVLNQYIELLRDEKITAEYAYQGVVALFGSSLQREINVFLNFIPAKAELPTPAPTQTTTREIAVPVEVTLDNSKGLAENLIDVAKITAGVVLGGLILGFRRRR